MEHKLPKLPYTLNALAPHISKETLQFHHGKHHKTYVERLNQLIKGTPLQQSSSESHRVACSITRRRPGTTASTGNA